MSTKPFKTLDEQVALLQSRGLVISDPENAKEVLANVNYYRFSAYSLTLRSQNIFYPGTTFEDIVVLYNFDSELRSIILRYTFNIETTLRTRLAYVHAKNHGPQGYLLSSNFSDPWHHAYFLSKLERLLKNSREPFVLHHRYDLHGEYPFWVAVEVMTFDVASKCFQNLLSSDQTEIAQTYHANRTLVENWLQCAVIARNISAHGGRFYNRPLSIKARIPNDLASRYQPDRLFAYIYGIYHLLSEPDDQALFIQDLTSLFERYPAANLQMIGFPADWQSILRSNISLGNGSCAPQPH